ncbi:MULTISPECIES: hypothetical protein, partial [Mesorhizobium]|uniref:hypothetical protein n=1 Tax=Mesorhizobium TaxID=68287 RepID=UPI00197EE3D5
NSSAYDIASKNVAKRQESGYTDREFPILVALNHRPRGNAGEREGFLNGQYAADAQGDRRLAG